jgi:nitroimidazol reductase NimA-like FMN-containing flavoprotein (pyridoxamine 5'-phosphate oxidase superfamily)
MPRDGLSLMRPTRSLPLMNHDLRGLAVRLLDEHRIMTIATNRQDGWPQATVVGYANDGLTIYCFISRLSQKYVNIMRDKRVSIAIAGDFSDPLQIKGLSLAAKAVPLEEKNEFARACEVFLKRYPEYASWGCPDPKIAPMLRVTPEIISVLDYSKGFGHSDLVSVSPGDLSATQSRSNWIVPA